MQISPENTRSIEGEGATRAPRLAIPRVAPPLPLTLSVVLGAGWLAAVVAGALAGGTVGTAIGADPALALHAVRPLADASAPGPGRGQAEGQAGLPGIDGDGGPADGADAAPPPPPTWRVSSLAKDPAIAVEEGTVGHRAFLDAVVAAGLSRNESYRLVRAFNHVHHFEKCNPKDTFTFAKERAGGRLVAFEYAESPSLVWQARQSDAGELEARKLDVHVERTTVKVGIAVGDDLRASVMKAGLDDDLVEMLDDALDGHTELADVRPGARFRIVATEERIDGVFADYAELDAVEYTPASAASPTLRVYRFGNAGSGEGRTDGKGASSSKWGKRAPPAGYYFDARGRQPYHGGWRSPVPLARIASRFNPRRMHPVLHVIQPHNGVDFAAPPGTPVYSTAAGIVKSVGDSGPCGNMVQVAHASGLVSAYCHLSRFAAGLHPGQHVEPRQLVGYVGRTGRTTGPHLHFAIKRGEAFLDPLALKLDGVRVVPLSGRGEFERTRAELDIAIDGIAMPAAGDVKDGRDGGTVDVDGGVEDTVFEESAE